VLLRDIATVFGVSGKDVIGEAVMTSDVPHSAGCRTDKESGQ